jgi:hypothetical protein
MMATGVALGLPPLAIQARSKAAECMSASWTDTVLIGWAFKRYDPKNTKDGAAVQSVHSRGRRATVRMPAALEA